MPEPTATPCAHHWFIEPNMAGHCKRCGATKTFASPHEGAWNGHELPQPEAVGRNPLMRRLLNHGVRSTASR